MYQLLFSKEKDPIFFLKAAKALTGGKAYL